MNNGRILFVRGKWLKDFMKQAVKFPSEKIIADDETTHLLIPHAIHPS